MAVYKRKDRQGWLVDVTVEGKRYRQLIKSACNETQALAAERKILAEIHVQKYGSSKITVPTLRQFLPEYLAWAKVNKRSWKVDEYHCRVIAEHLGHKRLHEIAPFDIEKFKIERAKTITPKKKLITKSAINRTLEVLSKIFTMAMTNDAWGIVKNPCRQVEKFSIERRPYRVLTTEEEQHFLQYLVGRRAHLAYIVVLNLKTGLRPSELVSLRITDVDFQKQRLNIENTKTKMARTVPFSDATAEVLRELIQSAQEKDSPFLFPSPRNPKKHLVRFNKAFAAAVREAGLASDGYTQNITPYKLRHTFATRLAEMTSGDAFTLQVLLGHAQISTSRLYVHVQEEQTRRAIDALEQYASTEEEKIKRRA
jgi:integrase